MLEIKMINNKYASGKDINNNCNMAKYLLLLNKKKTYSISKHIDFSKCWDIFSVPFINYVAN